jgi:triosephosphate isomerase
MLLMRKKIVAGNWKMNTSLEEAISLSEEIKQIISAENNCEIVVCPPFPWLVSVKEIFKNTKVKIGAQNVSDEEKGAFTGEVSASMIASAGVTFAIIGHSERRNIYNETDAVINKKLKIGLAKGLNMILCCGETLEERNNGNLESVIRRQLTEGIGHFDTQFLPQLIVAYEPVWAIGTGLTASPTQAQEVHFFIRKLLVELLGNKAENTPILYGGSCNASNAAELFSQTDIDGGLIGGASLKAKDFITIAQSF